MASVQDIQDVDLYELLGVEFNATVQEITYKGTLQEHILKGYLKVCKEVKSAYRKKALTCHPDKNPDNPKAAELFHELSRALEILIDASARAAYDKVLNAKKAAVLRNQELDSRRKKLKEDLEAREKQADAARKKYHSHDNRTDEEKLQAEIERLRKEGSKQVEEEAEYVRQQILREKLSKSVSSESSDSPKRLRIRWEANKNDPDNGGYNYELLHRMLSKYGEIAALIISAKKKGSALVEFATKEAAEMAQDLEKGLTKNPLSIQILGKEGTSYTSSSKTFPRTEFQNSGEEHAQGNATSSQANKTCTAPSAFPSFSFSPNIVFQKEPVSNTDTDFESLVLRRMRQAEERRKLTEEIMKSEQSSND